MLSSGDLLAGTEAHGLWASADSGQTWTRVSAEAIPDLVNAIVPGFPDQADDVALLLDNRILISTDYGYTWQVWAELEQPTSTIAATAADHLALVGTVAGQLLRVRAGNVTRLNQ